jgi:hypothetical protein
MVEAPGDRATSGRWRRALLIAVAACLCGAAALALAVLLLGRLGTVQTRILLSTLLAAGYALLALPAVVLAERGRLRALAAASGALSAVGFALAVAAVWAGDDSPRALSDLLIGTTAFAAAGAQAAALAATPARGRPGRVRVCVAAGLGTAAAAALTAAVVRGEGAGWLLRIAGSLAVLDLLVVALGPVLGRLRPAAAHRLRLRTEPGGTAEVEVRAADLGTAVARAIRSAERAGERVLAVEPLPRAPGGPPEPPAGMG